MQLSYIQDKGTKNYKVKQMHANSETKEVYLELEHEIIPPVST